MHLDAIILAGGRGARMGGADKPMTTIGEVPLLSIALDAVRDCEHRVVVGPPRELGSDIIVVQENPPGSGPVAAIAAGLATLPETGDRLVVTLAADLPFISATAVRELIRRLSESEYPAACAIDRDGHRQYLVAVWRRKALHDRLAALGTPTDLPVKALIPDDMLTVALDGLDDCDTTTALDRSATLAAKTPPTLDFARTILRTTIPPAPVVLSRLSSVAGAALSEPLHAADALPRFDSSAMDGYAVAGSGPWQLRTDTGAAGAEPVAALEIDTAVRIATGAPVPTGTTRVIRDEFTLLNGTVLMLRDGIPDRDDLRPRGEDWQAGDLLAAAGTFVDPPLLSLAASAGIIDAPVRGPVRAGVLLTGDEISSGTCLGRNQVRDALTPVLPEYLRHCAIETVSIERLRDTAADFDLAFVPNSDADLLVIVGATGHGAADYLRGALTRAGARVLVSRLNLRPGGSTVVAVLPDSRIVLGLPGNPFAAIALLRALAPAIVEARTARTAPRPVTGRLCNAGSVASPTPRILPARRLSGADWHADTNIRTAHLANLLGRDALAIVPANADDGAIVELLLLP